MCVVLWGCQPWVSGVPASVVSLALGLLLALLAEPLSESALVHVVVSALLGLFSLLILAAFVLNQLLRTVRSMQQVGRSDGRTTATHSLTHTYSLTHSHSLTHSSAGRQAGG